MGEKWETLKTFNISSSYWEMRLTSQMFSGMCFIKVTFVCLLKGQVTMFQNSRKLSENIDKDRQRDREREKESMRECKR